MEEFCMHDGGNCPFVENGEPKMMLGHAHG